MIEQVFKILNDLSIYGLEKLGLYVSKYRGIVADNQDPLGYGRLLLSVPDIYGDAVYNYWAWPANNYSGAGYGSQVLPQVNDIVWVEFERGNPRRPLWNFGHFGKGEKPEELKDVKNFWFKTPKGNLIEFDDTNLLIRITAANGKVIEINEENISLGSKGNSAEPAVLGETLKSKLDTMIDILKEAKINTSLGPQGFLPIFITQLDELKDSLEEFKSQKVTLD